MSLMSLQLWTIAELTGPFLTVGVAQFVVAFLFAVFVIFRVMGRDYEAAVICSDFGGISSLGATPTVMANFQHGRGGPNQWPGPSGLHHRAVGIGVLRGYQQCPGDPALPQLAEQSGGNC